LLKGLQQVYGFERTMCLDSYYIALSARHDVLHGAFGGELGVQNILF
jgi:hypothetical protein